MIDGDVYQHARDKAARLVSLPAISLKITKQMLRKNTMPQVIDCINEEAAVFMERVKSPEMKEAVTAFMQKRPADFRQFD